MFLYDRLGRSLGKKSPQYQRRCRRGNGKRYPCRPRVPPWLLERGLHSNRHYFANRFGSNRNFQRYSGKLFSCFSVSSTVNFGFRVEAESVSGERVPFFSYPFIMLRGIPSMRCQGEHMILAETELRWEFISRWNLVFFSVQAVCLVTSSGLTRIRAWWNIMKAWARQSHPRPAAWDFAMSLPENMDSGPVLTLPPVRPGIFPSTSRWAAPGLHFRLGYRGIFTQSILDRQWQICAKSTLPKITQEKHDR